MKRRKQVALLMSPGWFGAEAELRGIAFAGLSSGDILATNERFWKYRGARRTAPGPAALESVVISERRPRRACQAAGVVAPPAMASVSPSLRAMTAEQVRSPVTFTEVRTMSRIRSTPRMKAIPA